jgi:thiol-disulfide isomerase/thioredoxin
MNPPSLPPRQRPLPRWTVAGTAGLLGALLCLGTLQTAQAAEPASADTLIAAARTKAAADGKTIYVRFSASWCGWCQRHEAFLERPEIKAAFERQFVPVKLIVQESDEKKALENPGAEAWLKKVGGPEGLPFSGFLDAKGSLIVNSRRPGASGPGGGNIGHPVAPEEIDWFVAMMKKAAPKMPAKDLKLIETALREQKKP